MLRRLNLLRREEYVEAFLRERKQTAHSVKAFLEREVLVPDYEDAFTPRIIDNLVKISFEYYRGLSRRKKKHFLLAAIAFGDACLLMKSWEHPLARKDADWYWSGIPLYFGNLKQISEPLREMTYNLSLIDRWSAAQKLLLVEGESEIEFLRGLQGFTGASNFDFDIYCYNGKGNVRNLEHYIKEQNRRGVRVLLSYDRDGGDSTFAQRLKGKGCRLAGHFGFKKDLESAFPDDLLQSALDEYLFRIKYRLPISVSGLRRSRLASIPFLRAVEEEHAIQVKKPLFAAILGDTVGMELLDKWDVVFNNTPTRSLPEIYRFLKFVMR